MKNLNNKEIEGRPISVTVARERESKSGNNFGSRKKMVMTYPDVISCPLRLFTGMTDT
jgi:hypothetical protein